MSGQDFPPNTFELQQRQLSQYGRVGSTRVYTAPDLPAAIALSSFSVPVTIRFREPGIVLACYGQELAGTAAKFASTRVRVQIGGQEDLFTDGSSGTYLSFLALVGGACNWYPLFRRVLPGVDWIVTYQNLDAAATATPSFFLSFIADADMARGLPERNR